MSLREIATRMASPASRKLYRFGSFEVDPQAGEVRKHGIRIRVQDQPLLLLTVLLERPHTLITREELHSTLWPDHTFVDFENGLNTAAARLRQALGDSARTPRFIESVPRRGYRFIAAVETVPVEPGEPIACLPVTESQESLTTAEHEVQRLAGDSSTRSGDTNRVRRLWLLLVAGLVLISVAFIAWWLPLRNRPGVVRPFKFSLMAPEGTTFVQFDPLVLSPDGRLMVFPASDTSGETELWLRPLEELAARRLEGTKGASFPFWSPDGRSIAFFANGKLERVEVAGGLPRIVCDAADGRGGSWNRGGSIVFSPALKSPLFQVAAGGGEPKQLTSLDKSRHEMSHRWPYLLPDGRHFLYSSRTAQTEDSGIRLGSIAGESGPLLIRTPSNAIYAKDKSGSGYLVFAHDDRLFGRAFDDRRLRITGAEFPIAESPNRALMEPLRADFSASDTGVLTYGPKRGADRLTWFNRKGVRLETLGEPGIHLDVTISPNENEVAFSRLEPHTGRYDIWRVDRASGRATRVTYGPSDQVSPVWSPDASRVVYASKILGYSSMNSDTSGAILEAFSARGSDSKLLLKSDNLKVPWSTNGRFVLYHEIHPGKKIDTWALPIEDRGKPVPLLQGQSNQLFAVFSPNGKWVAYVSDESGKQEVYVTPFTPGAASVSKWLVSNVGGSQPQWPGDGRQLYYLAPDKRIMAVPVSTTEGRFRSGLPHALFQSDIIDDFRARFAVTSDGQRFLIPSTAGQVGSPFATVIVNWTPGHQN